MWGGGPSVGVESPVWGWSPRGWHWNREDPLEEALAPTPGASRRSLSKVEMWGKGQSRGQ